MLHKCMRHRRTALAYDKSAIEDLGMAESMHTLLRKSRSRNSLQFVFRQPACPACALQSHRKCADTGLVSRPDFWPAHGPRLE